MQRLGSDHIKALGLTAYQRKDYAAAVHYLRQALQIDPANARVHYLLGNVLREKGELDEAIIHYEESLRIDPDFAEAYNNLGLVLQGKGRLEEAADCYQKALNANPALAGVYYNLGTVFHDKKDLGKAALYYQEAIERDPNDADAHYNLAEVLREIDRTDDALLHYRAALALNPMLADAYNNMGSILSERGLFDDALECYQRALKLDPNIPSVYNNMGIALKVKGRLDEASEFFEAALRIDPSFVGALNNMAGVLLDQGRISAAEKYLESALRVDPLPSVNSSLLFVMNYNPSRSPETIYAEHVKFSKRFVEPLLCGTPPHTNELKADRRLRIGYVSPDFRRHSVAYFIEPVVASHDRKRVEVFCYSDVTAADDVTLRIQGCADQWRSVTKMSDKDVAELIRSDKIDILVDLAGHTERNRMLVFARKPAPVQVTWIGYPATTGLQTMDYKIVDDYTDPHGMTQQFYTEKLLRMPETFLCYLPYEESPDTGPLPSLTEDRITFGSFNNFSKVSEEILVLWSQILREVPRSRLLLKSQALANEIARGRVIDIFEKEGIAAERVWLTSFQPSVKAHLDLYNRTDIALDTFPYHGTTTTCEALWMGVPVITLAGNTHVSRVGVSLLSNAGLPELVAGTSEEYAAKAVNLANDPDKLKTLRKRLRHMMKNSSLTDRKLFTAYLEEAYRQIWKKWCGTIQESSEPAEPSSD